MKNRDNVRSIRGLDAETWEMAGNCAGRADETLAAWLKRAIEQLAAGEASGPRFVLPGKPEPNVKQVGMDIHDVGVLLQSMSAFVVATQTRPKKLVLNRAHRLFDACVRSGLGMRPPARSPGFDVLRDVLPEPKNVLHDDISIASEEGDGTREEDAVA
jgi:hypothetical protein